MTVYLTAIRLHSALPEVLEDFSNAGIEPGTADCQHCGETVLFDPGSLQGAKAKAEQDQTELVLRCLPCTLEREPGWRPSVNPESIATVMKVLGVDEDSFEMFKELLLQITSMPFSELGIPSEYLE